MNEERFIKLLKEAGDFELKCNEEMDNIIVNNIYNPPVIKRLKEWKDKLLNPVFLRVALAILIIGIIIFSFIQIRSIRYSEIEPQELYNHVISQIQEINNKKDIKKALNIYSDDFFKQNDREEVKKNIEILFKNYATIEYNPIKEKIIIKDNNALIENKIKYFARAIDEGAKSLSYQGKERIYLKRYRNKWKIVAWLYEEK